MSLIRTLNLLFIILYNYKVKATLVDEICKCHADHSQLTNISVALSTYRRPQVPLNLCLICE